MRRVKRLNMYNLHLEEIKSKAHSKIIENSHYKGGLQQIKGLNYVAGYDNFALANENECIDTQLFVNPFTNEINSDPKTLSKLYNYLRFRQYMDSDSIKYFNVVETCIILLENLPEALNFSDISSNITSFQVNK